MLDIEKLPERILVRRETLVAMEQALGAQPESWNRFGPIFLAVLDDVKECLQKEEEELIPEVS